MAALVAAAGLLLAACDAGDPVDPNGAGTPGVEGGGGAPGTATATETPATRTEGSDAPTPRPAAPATPVPESVPPEVANHLDEWPLPNRDYENTRAVIDSAITSATVEDLEIAWRFELVGGGTHGAIASAPIVSNGVLYFQDLAGNVYAVDAGTGETVWLQRFDYPVIGPNGPAIGYGKIFAGVNSWTFAALDMATGELLWQTTPEGGSVAAGQPVVFDDTVFATTTVGSETSHAPGSTGSMHALDVETGDTRWQFRVVREDDFWGMPGLNSGGGVWYPPAIDVTRGLTYWGTGNPGPYPGTVAYPNATSRPGPNLYTNSLVVLDDAGALSWYHQVRPADLFDLDFQLPPVLSTESIEGEFRDLVIGSGKLGRVFAWDARTQELLWDTEVGVHENDDLDELPLDGTVVEVFPGILGGATTPMALADGVVFVPVANVSTLHEATGHGATTGLETLLHASQRTYPSAGTGELVAIDVTTGDVLWVAEFDSPLFGGATVVGDLVFTATLSGEIVAFERETGAEAWRFQAPGGINGWPAVANDTIYWPVGLAVPGQVIALRLP